MSTDSDAPTVFAEDMPDGTMLEWPSAPRVATRIGELPFAAPSSVGQVSGQPTGLPGKAVQKVRFRYRNPGGGYSWSPPIEVIPGQSCRHSRPTPQ